MKYFSKKWLLVIVPLLAIGCGTKVSRVQSDSTIDLSGRWNDVDSRLVAEQMVNDCLGQRWLYKWDSQNKRPNVIIGKIRKQEPRAHQYRDVQPRTSNGRCSIRERSTSWQVKDRARTDQGREGRPAVERFGPDRQIGTRGDRRGPHDARETSIPSWTRRAAKRSFTIRSTWNSLKSRATPRFGSGRRR